MVWADYAAALETREMAAQQENVGQNGSRRRATHQTGKSRRGLISFQPH
jgi:hypothetical protein